LGSQRIQSPKCYLNARSTTRQVRVLIQADAAVMIPQHQLAGITST
jgi:hypothetical protein